MNKDLIDSKKFIEPISINNFDPIKLKEILSNMITIRKTEDFIAQKKEKGLIGGPVHLASGQEAIAVGISQNLNKKDIVFGNHRSHSHLIALNRDFYKLFAEILGKSTGFSKGMGGSMHLIDLENGFYGSTPIVCGTTPIAVGAAMASKLKKSDQVTVSYLGDGAVEEGVFHESLNLAKVSNAPILFVVENNLFASHMHISERQPDYFVSRFAESNHIKNKILDGNDVISVANHSKQFINEMRADGGPAFLECITYRLYGHVDWRRDVDVGLNRSLSDLEFWEKRDPIKRLSQSMIISKIWSIDEEKELIKNLDNEIHLAWEKAMSDPYPDIDMISKNVYAEN